MPSGRQSLQDKEPPAQDSCHGVATEVQKCSCSLSWPPALAAIREPTLCGVPRTARCPFVEAGLRFRHLQLKTLRISMDGAYLRFCGAPQNRKGIDGLARVCREQLQSGPFSGRLYVFRNRRGTTIKVLAYDGQGFWLAQKRLSKGRFRWWREGLQAREGARTLEAHQLQVLLAAGNPGATQAAPCWRALNVPS